MAGTDTSEKISNKKKNNLVVGIVAHVDAGKTTLAESLLYLTGATRRLGRVDHQDAFLDTYELEKSRGITIFSKQAQLNAGGQSVTLLDTPGHVDFSAEMERTLQILDYAILVISAADGAGGHVQTLWRLLKEYNVPTFVFVNKMDQPGADRAALLKEINSLLDARCVDFSSGSEALYEQAALTDERLLESFLAGGRISDEQLALQIENRLLFPVYFGSALKVQGVDEFINGLFNFMRAKEYPDEFSARVFKISRDAHGARLTHLKVTGGTLKVKQVLAQGKIDQLRLYSGAGFTPLNEAAAGVVCAVMGLADTFAGQGLGALEDSKAPLLEPVLTYRVKFDEGIDEQEMFRRLKQIEEEEPQLHLVWQEETREIHAQVMGEVQVEILEKLIEERFNVRADFTSGAIIYKETIESSAEGIGHFEPLRHYAEVHLLLEPGERGSGVVCESRCSEDVLAGNWQRLVLTHLEEKAHKGVLTGSELTDVRITLINGRAHIKHTEGGDFRQATYRAVRQGLMQARSRLLEPYYSFTLELPSESLGRAMTDIKRMCGELEISSQDEESAVIQGKAPVAQLKGYQREVTAYTKGKGRLSCVFCGYEICQNEQEIIESIGYDPQADLANSPDSVFCAHGAGFVVPWYEVADYAHLELSDEAEHDMSAAAALREVAAREASGESSSLKEIEAENAELKEIFERTYGPVKKRTTNENEDDIPKAVKKEKPYVPKKAKETKEYLLVDGYNIIFSWNELRELADKNIDAARLELIDIMSDYRAGIDADLILVFDAYKVKGAKGSVERYHNIHVVYTREAETADQYIEKTVHSIGRRYHVTVATSDGLEQVIILGQGGTRMSAADLKESVKNVRISMKELGETMRDSGKVYLFHGIEGDTARSIEDVRLGRNK